MPALADAPPVTGPFPPWMLGVIEMERALRSDDGRGAVLARRHMAAALKPDTQGADCPDPLLWRTLTTLAEAWAARNEPEERARLEGPLSSLITAVRQIASEAKRQRLARQADLFAAQAGLPPGDR
ncbi:hypothetical protein FKB34_01920 [Glycocaulis profundi]|nr:hypothetical protein FKB34_01920 [Glycocaulis profundi]